MVEHREQYDGASAESFDARIKRQKLPP